MKCTYYTLYKCKAGEIMDSSILIDYIERIYGYAFNKTFTREEADDLAQEILFTAVKELPKLKNIDSFEAWLWGVANNVTRTFRRYKGKQRVMYSYDCLENIAVYDKYETDNDNIYKILRAKIAMLSKIYRDIIIFYYYDNLTTKQIAQKLDIPEGTVTWRLSEGRKKIKKECMDMNESALRPVKMRLTISGSGNYNGSTIPFPDEFINDALSQNIFYHSYKSAKSVEELAKLCGVPAYYIESNIQNLIRREALIESVKGKYKTNFIIYDNMIDDYAQNGEKLLLPLIDKFTQILKSFSREISTIGIYKAGKDENELRYLYGILAFSELSKKYNPISNINFPVRYDGNRWSYLAHMEVEKRATRIGIGLGMQHNANMGTGNSYSHTTYWFDNFIFTPMMTDSMINICEKVINKVSIENTESIALVIEKGFVKREDNGELVLTVPTFLKEQKTIFDEKVDEHFKPFISNYIKAVNAYTNGYKKLFPKHLEDEAIRVCNYLFITLFTHMTRMAQEKGLLESPKLNSICNVLIQLPYSYQNQ